MTNKEQKAAVQCPKCGSTDIREKNIAIASANIPVTEWEFDTDGAPLPLGFDMDVDDSHFSDWSTEDTDCPYMCGGCREWEGSADELVIKRDGDA